MVAARGVSALLFPIMGMTGPSRFCCSSTRRIAIPYYGNAVSDQVTFEVGFKDELLFPIMGMVLGSSWFPHASPSGAPTPGVFPGLLPYLCSPTGGPLQAPGNPGRGVFASSRASIHPRSANHGQTLSQRQSTSAV